MYAARSHRFLGQCVDGLVAVAPLVLLFLIPTDSPAASGALALGWLGWFFFHLLLADGMEGGQSWGKRVVGTRVVDATTGAPCTFWQSFVRNLLLTILGPIDWIFIFGEPRQRLGDKAAGTIVIPAA